MFLTYCTCCLLYFYGLDLISVKLLHCCTASCPSETKKSLPISLLPTYVFRIS